MTHDPATAAPPRTASPDRQPTSLLADGATAHSGVDPTRLMLMRAIVQKYTAPPTISGGFLAKPF